MHKIRYLCEEVTVESLDPSQSKGASMFRVNFQESLRHVGLALEEPEAFALRWHKQGAVYPWWVFAALALTAMVGTITYGMTMGLAGGPGRMFVSGLSCTLAAGIAWSLPLPALYILNSLSGSRLQP